MQAKLPYLLLAVTLLFAVSCTKTKVTTVTNTITDTVNHINRDTINNTVIDTALQMPVASLLAKNIEIDSLAIFSAFAVESGSAFYASDSGVITKLGCLCLMKDTVYTVSLWDYNSQALLASAQVSSTDSLHFAYTAITPFSVSPNKLYMISYNTKDLPFYLLELKGDPDLAFPFSNGNITFTDSYFVSATTSTFPTNNEEDYLTPVDFVFQIK